MADSQENARSLSMKDSIVNTVNVNHNTKGKVKDLQKLSAALKKNLSRRKSVAHKRQEEHQET